MRWQAGADDDIPFMLRLIPCALLVVAAVQMMYLPKSASRLPDIEFKPARSVAHLAVLCLLILAAYALRIANINTYSYWQDEAAQIEAASRANIIEIARTVSARGAGAVPLDHILTSVALRIAGDAAILVDPANPRAISDAMLRVLSDRQNRAALIEKGFAHARRFAWSKTALATIEAYRAALERASQDRAINR